MSNNGIVVGIPAHNSGKFIGDLLSSLCEQTDKEFTVMVACDSCSDNTREVVDGFKGRLNLYSWDVDYRKPGLTRQSILDAAPPHSFVYFVDSDDLVTPRCVSTIRGAVPMMLGNDFFVSLGVEYTFGDGKRDEKEQHNVFGLGTRFYYVCGKVYDVEKLRKHGIRFNEKCVFSEDWDFNLQCLAESFHNDDNYTAPCLSDVVYKQRYREDSMTGEKSTFVKTPFFASDALLRRLKGKPKTSRYYLLYAVAVLIDVIQKENRTGAKEGIKRRLKGLKYTRDEMFALMYGQTEVERVRFDFYEAAAPYIERWCKR